MRTDKGLVTELREAKARLLILWFQLMHAQIAARAAAKNKILNTYVKNLRERLSILNKKSFTSGCPRMAAFRCFEADTWELWHYPMFKNRNPAYKK